MRSCPSAKRTLIWWSACPEAQKFENGLVEVGFHEILSECQAYSRLVVGSP